MWFVLYFAAAKFNADSWFLMDFLPFLFEIQLNQADLLTVHALKPYAKKRLRYWISADETSAVCVQYLKRPESISEKWACQM